MSEPLSPQSLSVDRGPQISNARRQATQPRITLSPLLQSNYRKPMTNLLGSRRVVRRRDHHLRLLLAGLLLFGCGSQTAAERSEATSLRKGPQMSRMLSKQPKSYQRVEEGLKVLGREVTLPHGSIQVFEQADEHFWTPDDDGANNAVRHADHVGRGGPRPSLLSAVSTLAPVTGLWPINTSEWEIPYPPDMVTTETPTPLETVLRGLRYTNGYSTNPDLDLPQRLATPGSQRTVLQLPDVKFSLVQADSLVDLIRYVPTETFNSYASMGHWISMVERFDIQVIAGEWHVLSLFLHRPPATREDAEILRLELASTGADEYPTADVLLEGGLFTLEYS